MAKPNLQTESRSTSAFLAIGDSFGVLERCYEADYCLDAPEWMPRGSCIGGFVDGEQIAFESMNQLRGQPF